MPKPRRNVAEDAKSSDPGWHWAWKVGIFRKFRYEFVNFHRYLNSYFPATWLQLGFPPTSAVLLHVLHVLQSLELRYTFAGELRGKAVDDF